MIVLYREINDVTAIDARLLCRNGGMHSRENFRKIKQFGAFWCILVYFNRTSMKFTTNDSAARKQ